MEFVTNYASLSWLDAVLVGAMISMWLGLGWWIEHPTAKRQSVTVLMSQYRREWMREMVTRNPRMFDALILDSLRQSTAFFASTCLLAVGGVLALIGNVDPLRGVADNIAHAQSPALIWQIKLSLMLLFLSNGFLKFVWANRVFGYCSVMMAAVPNDAGDPTAFPRAAKAAELNIRAAMNFNRGLRSIYFALGSVAWLAGPIPFLVAVILVGWLVWSREFASIPRSILTADGEPTET